MEAIPEADPEPLEVVAEEPAVPEPDPMPQSDESPDIPVDEGGDLHAVASDEGNEATHVSTETAFGDHPDTDATPPDVAHDRFEPSVESQALVEEQARSAIQDAFEEAPASLAEESPIAASASVAAATAVAEPEATAEPEAIAEPEATAEPEAIAEPEPLAEPRHSLS